jgi:hypothetical protein
MIKFRGERWIIGHQRAKPGGGGGVWSVLGFEHVNPVRTILKIRANSDSKPPLVPDLET